MQKVGMWGAIAVLVMVCVTDPARTQTAAPPTNPSPAATPGSAEVAVSGAPAWDRLKGNTITGKVSGQPFTEFFDAGGSVRYADKDGLSTGTWTVQNAKVCFDFPDDDDRSCSTFTVTGASGSGTDDDGMVTRFSVEPGNSKGL